MGVEVAGKRLLLLVFKYVQHKSFLPNNGKQKIGTSATWSAWEKWRK
jgi:hypothetical protein